MLRRASIRTRLLALLAIPTLAVLASTAVVVVDALALQGEVRSFAELAGVADATAVALGDVQVERLRTIGALLDESADADAVAARDAAREATVSSSADVIAAIDELQAAGVPEALADEAIEVRTALLGLPALRASAEPGGRLPDDVVRDYDAVVRTLLDAKAAIAQDVEDPTIGTGLRTASAVAELTESHLRQADVVLYGIGGLRNRGTVGDQASSFAVERQVWLQQLRLALPAADVDAIVEVVGDNAAADTNAIITALNAHTYPPPAEYAADVAQDAAALRAVEAGVGARTAEAVDALSAAATRRLAIGAGLVLVALFLVIGVPLAVNRSIARPLRTLAAFAQRVREELPSTVERLRGGGGGVDDDANDAAHDQLVARRDEFGALARVVDAAAGEATRVAVEQSQLRAGVIETITDVARREQALVERQLALLEQLEQSEDDPDQLAQLFRLDHLATRLRRNAENLLVLSGSGLPGATETEPTRLLDVVRSASSEIEDYARVDVRIQDGAAVLGHAAAPLAHLVAELMENATSFSPPTAPVEVTATHGSQGVLVRIRDHGIGMSAQELQEARARLASPPALTAAESKRLGLYVVGVIGQRLGVHVDLERAPDGDGLVALVGVPYRLLAVEEAAPAPAPPVAPDAASAPAAVGPARDLVSELLGDGATTPVSRVAPAPAPAPRPVAPAPAIAARHGVDAPAEPTALPSRRRPDGAPAPAPAHAPSRATFPAAALSELAALAQQEQPSTAAGLEVRPSTQPLLPRRGERTGGDPPSGLKLSGRTRPIGPEDVAASLSGLVSGAARGSQDADAPGKGAPAANGRGATANGHGPVPAPNAVVANGNGDNGHAAVPAPAGTLRRPDDGVANGHAADNGVPGASRPPGGAARGWSLGLDDVPAPSRRTPLFRSRKPATPDDAAGGSA